MLPRRPAAGNPSPRYGKRGFVRATAADKPDTQAKDYLRRVLRLRVRLVGRRPGIIATFAHSVHSDGGCGVGGGSTSGGSVPGVGRSLSSCTSGGSAPAG